MRGRKQKNDDEKLKNGIRIRLTKEEFEKLKDLKENSYNIKNTSQLVRYILFNKKLITYTRDKNFDKTIEEITNLRKEFNAVGNNINQITKVINTLKNQNAISEQHNNIIKCFNDLIIIKQKLEEKFTILTKKWLQK